MGQLQLELDSELNKKCFKLFNLDDIKSGEKRYKVLELFSGAGGMALGLHKELNLDDAEDGDLIHTDDEEKADEDGFSIIAMWNWERKNYFIKE